MFFSQIIEYYTENEALIVSKWMPWTMIITGLSSFLMLTLIPAPYGRYSSKSWGILVPSKLAWFVQETPSFLVPLLYNRYMNPGYMFRGFGVSEVLLSCLLLHYFQRSFIFPFLIRGGKPTPLIPFGLAFVFCCYNGLMQGSSLLKYSSYSADWFGDIHFCVGIALFFIGMGINIHSDHILRNLRKPGETGYKIPKGGMFNYVSGANFFGECLEWTGWAIACWSLPAAAFAAFTWLNIGPRAVHHHRFYCEKFRDSYPKNRKAIIPFIL